jgi:transcriptional regulator
MMTAELYRVGDEAVDALIAAYPFALVVSGGETPDATSLPILLERQPAGDRLIGHFARGNPQARTLLQAPRALFVFQGPHGYISPSWMADRTQAPTWNFATVHITADVEFLDGPDSAKAAVERLTGHMEAGRTGAWSAHELGARYERLAKGVIAFQAAVVSIQVKFKLGQNEHLDVLRDILDGLQETGQDRLRAAMILANADRLGAAQSLHSDSAARTGV